MTQEIPVAKGGKKGEAVITGASTPQSYLPATEGRGLYARQSLEQQELLITLKQKVTQTIEE